MFQGVPQEVENPDGDGADGRHHRLLLAEDGRQKHWEETYDEEADENKPPPGCQGGDGAPEGESERGIGVEREREQTDRETFVSTRKPDVRFHT